MKDEIVLRLPAHAARYLAGMCRRDRNRLVRATSRSHHPTLQEVASFDSLSTIEEAFPPSFWTDAEP